MRENGYLKKVIDSQIVEALEVFGGVRIKGPKWRPRVPGLFGDGPFGECRVRQWGQGLLAGLWYIGTW